MDKTLWGFYEKAKRKDVLSFDICNVVVKFWTYNMRVGPNMKSML